MILIVSSSNKNGGNNASLCLPHAAAVDGGDGSRP